jgi:hypothetical protein
MAKLKSGTRVYGNLLVDTGVDLTAVTLTTPVLGMIEYDGTTFYATGNASYGRGTIPLTNYTSGAGTAGITGSTNFAIFPAANDTITLPIGTYFVRMRVRVAVSGSTVNSTLNINLRGAGTAVGSFSWGGSGSVSDGGAPGMFIVAATALGTNISVTGNSSSNPRQYITMGEGILKVTTAGTIIPAYQFGSTLTSGTTTLVADNYMTIQQLDTQSAAAAGPSGTGWG